MISEFKRQWPLAEKTLLDPLRWRKPVSIRLSADLFHEDAPDEWIDKVIAVMALCPQHTFQVLTKWAARMQKYMDAGFSAMGSPKRMLVVEDLIWKMTAYKEGGPPDIVWPLPNVWLGVSAERQQEADERIPLLLQTPATIRFVSAEPLLGPIDLTRIDIGFCDTAPADRIYRNALSHDANRLDWIIVGGESGPSARPMSIQWARELRDQCRAAGVAFFFKQWGEWAPAGSHHEGDPGRFAFGDYEHDRHAMIQVDGYPRQFTKFGARSTLQRVGKREAGRLLDGIEHNAKPSLPSALAATPNQSHNAMPERVTG